MSSFVMPCGVCAVMKSWHNKTGSLCGSRGQRQDQSQDQDMGVHSWVHGDDDHLRKSCETSGANAYMLMATDAEDRNRERSRTRMRQYRQRLRQNPALLQQYRQRQRLYQHKYFVKRKGKET